MIRVILADDQPLLRGGFRALIDAEDDIEVIGEASNGIEAVALTSSLRPDVVLLDVEMPDGDGLSAVSAITAVPELDGVRVVMLTNYSFDEYVFRALKAGACGYLVKDIEPADFLQAIRTVATGEKLLSPTITRKLIAEYVSRPLRQSSIAKLSHLTEREREVVGLVARGMSNDDIAAHLTISGATAKTHVHRAMTKLHARDRAQIVVIAYESGLVAAPHRES